MENSTLLEFFFFEPFTKFQNVIMNSVITGDINCLLGVAQLTQDYEFMSPLPPLDLVHCALISSISATAC